MGSEMLSDTRTASIPLRRPSTGPRGHFKPSASPELKPVVVLAVAVSHRVVRWPFRTFYNYYEEGAELDQSKIPVALFEGAP